MSGPAEYGSLTEQYVEEHSKALTGLAVGAVNARGEVYREEFGWSDKENSIPVTEDSVFEWGSVTKLLVWVAVMQQAEAGKLDLKSDIRGYLPAGFLPNVREGQMVTLEHLMKHTAGFQEKLSGLYVKEGSRPQTLEQALQDHPPAQVFDAGEVTATSHWGAALAAYVVERVSGEDFAAYVRAHIFEPLGMNHTALLPDASDNTAVQDRKSATASYTKKGRRIKGRYVTYLYPSGMCVGTLQDMMIFAQALLPENRTAGLFSDPATLAALYLPTDLFSDGSPKNSHGFWNYTFGTRVLGQAGSTVGQSAALYIDPVGGIGVCVMTNRAEERVFCRDMMEKVFFGSFEDSAYNSQGKLPSGKYKSARGIFQGPLLFTRERASGITGGSLNTRYWVQSALGDGRTRFEQVEADRISVPFWSWAGEWLLTAWFVLSAAGSLGYLILGITSQLRLRRRRRKGGGREQPEPVWLLVLLEGTGDLTVLVLLLHMAAIVRRLRAFASTSAITPLLAANGILWILLLFLWGGSVVLFVRLKRDGVSRERGPAFALRMLLWLGAILCCWYWQVMPFWNW